MEKAKNISTGTGNVKEYVSTWCTCMCMNTCVHMHVHGERGELSEAECVIKWLKNENEDLSLVRLPLAHITSMQERATAQLLCTMPNCKITMFITGI